MNQLTRDVFVQQTCELLRQSDRNDMPLSVLLESCGAKKGSLYHFFPGGKDELIVASVEHMSRCARSHVAACLASTASVADAVYRQITDLSKCMDVQGAEFAIPFTAVVAITGADNELVRLACEKALKTLEEMFLEALKSEGVSLQEARGLANFIVTSFEGAFLFARINRSSKAMQNCARQLRNVINTHVSS